MLAGKATVVRLEAARVGFDEELLRMAAGWTGGFLEMKWTNVANYKGDNSGAAVIQGETVFHTPAIPGWTTEADLADPRTNKMGPLPKTAGRYRGLFLNEDKAIFMYEALGREVLESPETVPFNGGTAIVRHFTVGNADKAGYVVVADPSDAGENWSANKTTPKGAGVAKPIRKLADGHFQIVAAIGDLSGLAIKEDAGQPVRVMVPASAKPASFDIAIFPAANQAEAERFLTNWSGAKELTALCHGGPQRWPETVTVTGSEAQDNAAYVVDNVPLPDQNPWKSWVRVSGFDFFPDGRAAVCSFGGDVWIVSGLEGKLDHVVWKRFAQGLYEPLGLKIVDNKVYVLGRDQITRLNDVNNDGEADFYECFNADASIYPSYHAFAFDLQTDSKGNFYYVTGGNQIGHDRPWHACVIKVSADGSKAEQLGDGFRAPNGMEIGPNDEIAVGDNQGHWIPSSKISLVKPGGFYGHVADPRIDAKASVPASYDGPLLWIPYTWDNSSAGGVWAPSGTKWGPLGGHLLHTSYGKCSLFEVMEESVGETKQAGIVRLPLDFVSGIMRARFNPKDGQLWVGGLKGWQTNGAKDGCFERVRYTGKPTYLPTEFHVTGKNTLAITFPVALDRSSAGDAGNFSIEEFNYKWWSTYGSPDMSVKNPTQKGRDKVEVTGAKLSPDGKTVTLTVAELKKVDQMIVSMRIKASDGSDVKVEVGNTINKVPGA